LKQEKKTSYPDEIREVYLVQKGVTDQGVVE